MNAPAMVWSKRLEKLVPVNSVSQEAVDELLRTGAGTRMLVPDYDPTPPSKRKERDMEELMTPAK